MDLGKIAGIINNKSKTTPRIPSKMEDESEKVIINRMLNQKLPIDQKTPLEILRSVSVKSGVSMPFLAANAFQEGMNKMINESKGKSDEDFLMEADYTTSEDFPISGYKYYGLDTFGNVAPELKKKGYLPKDFSFDTVGIQNEKKEEVTSANFKSNEDALTAKAAFIRNLQDHVSEYADKKNVKLDPKTMDYIVMGGFNGGLGNARMMVDELATGKFNQKDYVDKGQTSRQGVHVHIPPRIKKMGIIEKLTSGPVAPYRNPTPTFDDILEMVKRR